jgi:hypothetical protein
MADYLLIHIICLVVCMKTKYLFIYIFFFSPIVYVLNFNSITLLFLK